MYAPLALASPLGGVRPFSSLLLPQTEQFSSRASVSNVSVLQYSMTYRLLHMIYCVYSGSHVRILAYSRNSRLPQQSLLDGPLEAI
jgi:hypothetical protein